MLALSWATCKRLKNIARLSLAGVAVVAADYADNPHGFVMGAHMGPEKAYLDPSRRSGAVDEVRFAKNLSITLYVWTVGESWMY